MVICTKRLVLVIMLATNFYCFSGENGKADTEAKSVALSKTQKNTLNRMLKVH